jgi:DNA modification methylase
MVILGDCFENLDKIEDNSIDLILTDPPYEISKKSYFMKSKDERYNKISIDFGDWDKEKLDLDTLFSHYKRILKSGGSLIIFYDIWKCNELKNLALKYKFKQNRICQWVKNNPTPINSNKNYLSNAIEFFFTFTKDGKPTFNSEYDNGVYNYALCGGRNRTKHPTQKPTPLFRAIIEKHSNPGDLILDTFGGSGTTAVAAIETDRRYIIIEKEEEYYDIINLRINQALKNKNK